MKTKAAVSSLIAMTFGLFAASPVTAATIDLSNPYNIYQTYGNVNVYSLPYQSLIYEQLTGTASAYKVLSGPGQIMDQVVIYTGASGTDVRTNASGFDDAYLAPNGQGAPYADTTGAGMDYVPVSKAEIANDALTTWDASLLAMKSFLNGGDAVFMFNNNDTNKDQTLAIWAKLWVTNGNNDLQGQYLYLSNMGQVYGTQQPPGGDASLYNPGNLSQPGLDPLNGKTDYVMSGGQVCFDKTTLAPEACDATSFTVNHNLGANEVAYAGMLPVLDGYFDSLFALTDEALSLYTLHIDLRIGCDARWEGLCDNIKIDNGFEQLWLTSTKADLYVPEPGTLVLAGLGLLGLGALRRRSAK